MDARRAAGRIEWGHCALLIGIAALTGWYLFDAWSASPRTRNLILILPVSVIVGVLIVIIAAGVVARALGRSPGAEPDSDASLSDVSAEAPLGRLQPLVLMGLFALYILTLPTFGFDVGAALFVFLALLAEGERRPLLLALYPPCFAAGATLAFDWLLPYPMHTLIL